LATDGGDSDNFLAVLNGTTALLGDTNFVQTEMLPCFPGDWDVGILWVSAMSKVCCDNLLNTIGGQDANRIYNLSVGNMMNLIK